MTHQLPPEIRFITEDDIYRTSSQYRLWSFSPESLAALRRKTHDIAVERIEKQRKSANGANGDAKVDYLSEEECLRLVQKYCDNLIITANKVLKWPVSAQATAVQYLRRFYLTNSPLTHPPKEIWKTCAFLANKTESLHMEVQEYAKLVSAKPEEILAAEYKVMQALRFTLDVRQPNRGLKGAYMELLNMEAGMPEARHKQAMAALAAPEKQARSQWKGAGGVGERLQAAHAAAKDLLDAPALLTDAYFLYTPSQLVFAALQLADPPLTQYYLENKLPTALPTRPKILSTIRECADLLASFSPAQVLTKDQRAALEARLDVCRDPSTRDLVGRHLARQRGEGLDEEEKAKKRAAQKKQREADDPFGPALT